MTAITENLKKYTRRVGATITAVQINLNCGRNREFSYEKWGSAQLAKEGDWLVNNGGDCYTINQESFAKTYREVSPGQYAKTGAVWAKQVDHDGRIATKEGFSAYATGDMVVFNNEDATDGYAMSADKFDGLYEPVE